MISSLKAEELQALYYDWQFWARPNQLPPQQNWRIWLLCGGRGSGKMLSLDTPLPTPNGWTTMGEVKVGDNLFDEAGQVCRVVAVHPVTVPDVAYRLYFSDGSTIDACSEHQWVTWTHAERKSLLRSPYDDTSQGFPDNWPAWRRRQAHGATHVLGEDEINRALAMRQQGLSLREIARITGHARNALVPHLRAGHYCHPNKVLLENETGPRVRTTQQIVDTLTYNKRGDINHCIPLAQPLQLPSIQLPISPYVLGCWLGDGTSASAEITIGDEDFSHIGMALTRDGMQLGKGRRKPGINCATYPMRYQDGSSLTTILRLMGVRKNKHIPQAYLRAGAEQRLALLRGLLDTDGGVEHGCASFYTTSCILAYNVQELAVSLGMRVSMERKSAKLYGMECGTCWTLRIMQTNAVPFSLPRKVWQLRYGVSQNLRRYHRMIVDARPIPPAPMRCITVDSPHGLFLAGRSMIPTHNSRTICEWAIEQARKMPGSRGAIVGSTAGDTRDILVEGESGILACSPPWFKPSYQPSKRKIVWPNGSVASVFSAELPERLRGPQFHWAICDELASWRTGADAYNMLMLGLRLGDDPRCAIATTPKAVPHLKTIMKGEHTVVTKSTTYENLCNLAEPWAEEIITRYEGTRLGRQELLAEFLEDSENALWKRKDIDDHRADHHPDLPYIVVGVDPSITSYGNEAGIIVAGRTSGRGRATQYYVLDDRSLRASPHGWATAVVAAYNKHQADMVIAESNQGGEMVSQTIKSVKPDIPVRLIQATRGKRLRAEPVAALYEVGRVHHCGLFPELESEMCLWEPGIGESPNRLDAAVHALQALSRTNLGWARGPMAN